VPSLPRSHPPHLPHLALLLAALLLTASPASALRLTLSAGGATTQEGVAALTAAPGEVLSFVVVLDEATSLNGYELSFAFDPAELAFRGAEARFPTSRPGGPLGFTVAPDPAENPGVRVAQLALDAFSTTGLFAVQLESLLPSADGLPDLAVFATSGGLAPATPLENGAGIGFDLVAVPEPAAAWLLAVGWAAAVHVRRSSARP